MKKRIQILLIFLVVIIGLGVLSTNQAFAADDYTISIGTISYTAQPNVLTRSSPVPSVVANHENVQMEKSCYVGETFSLTAIIVPSNAYVGEVIWTIEQDAEWHQADSMDTLSQRQRAACYGKGYYVMAGLNGEIAYSQNGSSWTEIPSFTNGVITGLAYGNGCFMAIDYNGTVYKATDPTGEWTLVYTAAQKLESVRFNNNVFMIVGENGFVATSNDGSAWTVANAITALTLIDSAYGNSYYIVVGNNGTVYRSMNLTDWENCSISDFGAIRSATFDGKNFVIGGVNGKIAYSEDGQNWTYATTNSTSTISYIRGFACTSNKVYAVMYTNTGTGEIWMSSDNGATWIVAQSVDYRLWTVCAGNNMLVAGGDNGFVITANHDSRKEIAKVVSQNGLSATIVGVNAGTCNIICAAADGQGAYTTCKLTVYQKAEEIILLPQELVLEPGDTQQLIATVLPEDTTDKTLHWESSDEEIVTVDSDGVVTAIQASDKPVTITATVMDGSNVSAKATVYVRIMANSLEWVKFSNVIYKSGNNTETFAVKVNPDNTTMPTVKYSTSDPSIATVVADSTDNSQVIVTPKKPGKFILTVETTDGSNLKLSAEVEVVQLVEHISLNTTEKILFLEDGQTVTYQLIATALPTNATVLSNQDKFIWSSSDDTIATVNNKGLVTAVSPGTTIITVKANDVGGVSATCIIHVRKAVTKIEIDLYTFEYIANSATNGIKLLEQLKYLNGIAFMYSGDEVALNAKFNADATTTTLMWQIPGVAKDADGNNIIGVFGKLSNAYANPTILTAMPINTDNEDGYLTITINCKATDGSGVTSQRVVQIRQPATSVEFSTTDMTLYVPDSSMSPSSAKIVPTILPENAYVNMNPDDFTDGQIIWVSSDENVATVDEFGRVTAVAPGEATIIGTVADGQGAFNKCTVTVIQPVERIDVYSYQDDLRVDLNDFNAEDAQEAGRWVFAYTDQEIRLYTSVFPENATNSKLTWYSSDPEFVEVENGFLKIGSKANATINEHGTVDGVPVVIRVASTDGSGVSFALNLMILDAGYSVEMEETISINAGDTDKLLLKVFKTQTLGDKLITYPIPVDATIKLSGDKVGEGDDQFTVMEIYDANGAALSSGNTLNNVTNPSFDIKGIGNGLATVTLNVSLNELGQNLTNKTLIGKKVSFERTCVVNVVGTENRHISMESDSLTVLVGQRKMVTTIVTPSNAINYYIKYSLEPVNDDYANPYQYARIDADSGILDGVAVGQVKVVATLYDTDTGMPIKYGDEEERCEAIAYISAALTGVQMKDSVVYVGESLNLLDCTTILPEVLDDTLALSGLKSSVLKFEVLSGDECIRFTSSAGTITGINHGTVRIKAIATYQTAIYTSPEVTISVRERLTGLTLTDTLYLKINQVQKLTPIVTPLMADTVHVKTTWTSSKIGIVTVDGDSTNNNLTGILTAKAEGKAKVTISIKLPDSDTPIEASCDVVVIGMYADDFSSLTPGEKHFYLGKSSTPYYRWGAYKMINAKNSSDWYAAGCMENGAFSLSTVYLYNTGETTVYSTSRYTRYYPSMFPLRTFLPLERVEEIMRQTAKAGGFEGETGYQQFVKEFNQALYISAQLAGRPDEYAYLDMPDKSHILTRSGNSYRTKNFSHWGYGGLPAYIFTGLSTQWESKEYGATLSASQVVEDISQHYTTTKLSYSGSRATRFSNSYFTSALTALNTVAGSGEIATRQANAMSIILTYFPLDDMQGSGNYHLYHTTRQMLMWAVSGIQTNAGYANKLDQDYVFDTPHYTGYNMKYVIYMLQAESDATESGENHMEYPHGYSSFYYACSSIVAAGRFYNVPTMMTLVKGFVWKLDQVKHMTIPSFASPEAHGDNSDGANFAENLIEVVWSSSDNAYVARLADENGVLNYFNFKWDIPGVPNGVTFTNNGDGTLTVKIKKEAKDYMVNNKNSTTPAAYPTYLPPDNKYACAAFTKWECETEVFQMPYTKSDGSLGYAYLMGQNAQSQSIDPGDVKSSLGDPITAYMAFKFEDVSQYESMVESQVQLLNQNGVVVEYVIPGEQYQLQYTYTYIGDSRGMSFVNENESGRTIDTSIYGFAADLRARTNMSQTLKNIMADGSNGNQYIKSSSSVTNTDAVWGLSVDKTPVNITGSFIIYNTPYGGIDGENAISTYEFDWSHNIQIDGRHDGLTNAAMKNSASDNSGKSYTANITDVQKLSDDKIRIEWTFYSGWITLTSPYVKASADISIGADTNHGVTTKYNTSSDAAKYIYGLTIDGSQAVHSGAGSTNSTANNANDYVSKYVFTGVADNVVNARNSGNISLTQVPFVFFDGAPYSVAHPDPDDASATLYYPFSQMSLSDIIGYGSTGSDGQIGDFAIFQNGSEITGFAVNIGKPQSGYNGYFWGLWRASTGTITIVTREAMGAFMSGSSVRFLNFNNYIPQFADEDHLDGEGLVNVGSSATLKDSEGITTSFNNSGLWSSQKNNLSKFTMTNHQTYGGAGYFNADFDTIVSSNAINSTWFHTDKTWQTVFDLSVSNLVVNTGAGITSPTLADTRSYVNLNIYYTLELDNSAYKMIVNRYGQVGSAWRMYYKFPSETSATLQNAESAFYFRKQDFYYLEGVAKKWCTANEAAKSGVTYYYVNTDSLEAEHTVYPTRVSGSKLFYKESEAKNAPEKSGPVNSFYYIKDGVKYWCTPDMDISGLSGFTHVLSDYIYEDKMSSTSTSLGDFIPDDMENILTGASGANYTRPAGYSEEKPCDEIINTDAFVHFSIYDATTINDGTIKLDADFVNLQSEQQLEILNEIVEKYPDMTNIPSNVFVDNIRTGKNYIQHSLPYVFNNIESGLKVFGFSANVNTTANDAAKMVLNNGSEVYINKALCEWGRYVGQYTKDEETKNMVSNNKYGIGHASGDGDPNKILAIGSSKLGYRTVVRNIDVLHSANYNLANNGKYKYKKFYYAPEYAESYDNNATATGMLQYPAYNPFTLSTVSTNGSLIYKNGAGVEGFDMVLGNNKTLHVPNTDVLSYNVFDRNFGAAGVNNAGLITNKNLAVNNNYTSVMSLQGTSPNVNGMTTQDFQFKSLAFYKYSNTSYTLLGGTVGMKPNVFNPVNRVPAQTEILKDNQTESYKITEILFRSTYTVSRKLGDNGWVDITEGSNPDALVNAGKGFELKIQVTYSNNNLTEYLSRYSKDSAQVGILSSATSGVTNTQCNISALTGQYGDKSMIDAYTAKYKLGDGTEAWNDVFGANLYKDIYVVMNNNNKYVYSYSGIYGTNNVFDVSTEYDYSATSGSGKIILTYTMRLSPVNGYFGNTDMNENDVSGLATQNMKFYTDAAAAGTVGSLTIWTNPLVATPFDYPNTMKDRYLADLKQIQYYIVQPSDNVDNIVQ